MYKYGLHSSTARIALILLTIFCMALVASAEDGRSLQVLAGGESHAMIDACDCELQPGGGVAKRASLIAALPKKGELLLLDAGGFSAGGIYDDYTEGRIADSLRTIAMIRAMGMMRYDAVAIGDDDLQLGGTWLAERAREDSLRLVCANCYTRKGKPLVDRYRIVNKNNLRIAVTAVTTSEQLFPVDASVIIRDPKASIQSIWKEMRKKSDLQVILSHLGEEETTALAKAFPEADLIVNGHRKNSKEPLLYAGKIPVLQFGFQGKSLSGVKLSVKGSTVTVADEQWYDVVPELPDDAAYSDLVPKNSDKATKELTYDLYIMSQCPYGLEALGEFLAFRKAVPSVTWNLWFIGTAEDDATFSSLHGEEEVLDEMRWLAVRELYPQKWLRFLSKRTVAKEPTLQLLKVLGVNPQKIAAWVEKNGNAALKRHYDRSTRLSINASPTLMVNNRPFGRTVVDGNLRRFHCSATDNKPEMCSSLPECVEDTDCRAPGKLGRCVDGKCEFRDAVPFVFIVVIAEKTTSSPEEKVIATTRELFPGATIETFSAGSKKGKKLIADNRIKRLPFYLFGKEVALTHNFSSIEKGLEKRKGGFTFQNGIVPVNFHLGRKRMQGTTVLYVDPFFKGLPDILRLMHEEPSLRKKCTILPVMYQDPAQVERGTEEWFRQEEALRWLVLGNVDAAKKRKYLSAYAENQGSSYWNRPLAASGVTVDSLMNRVSRSGDALAKLWNELMVLTVREPVVLLLDNVETVVPGDERELRSVLMKRVKMSHREP